MKPPYCDASLSVEKRHEDQLSRLRIEWTVEQFAFRGLEEGWLVEPGTVEVRVGGPADDVRLAGIWEITGPPVRLPRRTRFTTSVRVEEVQ